MGEQRISRVRGNLRTRATEDEIRRIIELHEDRFMLHGISVRMKSEGMYVSRETVKKILIINGYDLG